MSFRFMEINRFNFVQHACYKNLRKDVLLNFIIKNNNANCTLFMFLSYGYCKNVQNPKMASNS